MKKKINSASKSYEKRTLSILIPIYNEERTILRVLEDVVSLQIDNFELIVVNDASSDKTLEIVNSFKKTFKRTNPKILIISHPKNRGKGGAIKTALNIASGEYFTIQDADLEYSPNDLPPLLEIAQKDKLSVIYGSRFAGSIRGMPKPNYYANKFYNFLLRRLYNSDITDMHTCYKMVNTALLKDLDMQSDGFDYATELVSKILKRGIVIKEEPITFSGRTKLEGKKIGYSDGVECIYKLLKYRFSKNL